MALPQAFIDEINSYGADCLSGLADALTQSAPSVSVRVNRAKGATVPDGVVNVPWCEDGFYLDERPAFTFDPVLHQGLYYVQDASSMAIARAVKVISEAEGLRPLVCLDACAAPGGKTTAMLSALPAYSLVVANEYDYRRAAILAENIAKWGNPRVMVTRGDTARFGDLRRMFDIIAADVPCSGEGMMRKDDEAVTQWSPALVSECVARQREIVDNLWGALRPGGYMIYSTCTFNRHENEEMVEYICSELGGETIDIGLAGSDGIEPGIEHRASRIVHRAPVLHCCRFIPGLVRGEGLFMAVIRKDGDAERQHPKAARKPLTTFAKAPREADAVAESLNGDYRTVMIDDTVYALPADCARLMSDAASWLDVISAGTAIGTVKGRDIVPAQPLALSASFKAAAFPRVELSYDDALAYLRRESVNVDAPRGYVLTCYGGCPLGFVKNLGNRANNLYPQPWRIMSPNSPDTPPTILSRP